MRLCVVYVMCLCSWFVMYFVLLYGMFVCVRGGDACLLFMCLCVVCELLCDVVWIVVV